MSSFLPLFYSGVLQVNFHFPKFEYPAWGNQEVAAGVDCGIRKSRRRSTPGFPSVSPAGCFRSRLPLRVRSIPQKRVEGGSGAEAWHWGHGTPSRSLVTSLGMTRAQGRLIKFFWFPNCELDGLRGSIQPVARCCIREDREGASCDLFKRSIIHPLLVIQASYHSPPTKFHKKIWFMNHRSSLSSGISLSPKTKKVNLNQGHNWGDVGTIHHVEILDGSENWWQSWLQEQVVAHLVGFLEL